MKVLSHLLITLTILTAPLAALDPVDINPAPVATFFNTLEKNHAEIPHLETIMLLHQLTEEQVAVYFMQQAAAVERLAHYLTYTNSNQLAKQFVPPFFAIFERLGDKQLADIRYHHLYLVRRDAVKLLEKLEQCMLTISRSDTLSLQLVYDLRQVIITFQYFMIPSSFPHASALVEWYDYAMAYEKKGKAVFVGSMAVGACVGAWWLHKQLGDEKKAHQKAADQVTALKEAFKGQNETFIVKILKKAPRLMADGVAPPTREQLEGLDFSALSELNGRLKYLKEGDTITAEDLERALGLKCESLSRTMSYRSPTRRLGSSAVGTPTHRSPPAPWRKRLLGAETAASVTPPPTRSSSPIPKSPLPHQSAEE